jgi:hypothetical protein
VVGTHRSPGCRPSPSGKAGSCLSRP